MIQRMLPSALFAGLAAGLIAALLQFLFVEKLILLAEEYETGARVHFAGLADHHHEEAATATAEAEVATEATTEADGHDHDHAAMAEDRPPAQRYGLTAIFSVLLYAGCGLIMVAGFAAAGTAGHRPDVKAGLLWGLAGFACLQLAPALGLAPELPGTVAADLAERQTWWVGTAAATAAGLGLLAFGQPAALRIAGLGLLAVPHLIGAPVPEAFHGIAPPELASAFAARSLAVGLVAWLVLGAVLARLWSADAD